MKGIVLAGGLGTRLRPLTKVTNKHLLPVYDKLMIEYPLQTLVDMGCDEILVVAGQEHVGDFAEYLGDGSRYNVKITYKVQVVAGGIAQALQCAQGFIAFDEVQPIVPVILGDNYFSHTVEAPTEEAIVLCKVDNPERFGVYDRETNQIIEKPEHPISKFAVTGLYFYKPRTIWRTQNLQPSSRGELEITDVNNQILMDGAQDLYYIEFWSDMGTLDSLMEVANYVKDSVL